MKKSKERKDILKQAGGIIFLYIVPCLLLAYDSYYRNADLRITVRIAECVFLFVTIGAVGSLIKKENDPRKYNGYMMLCVSLGLILQIMLQGGILGEKRVMVCVIGYALAILAGIFTNLLLTEKIVIKNEFIREVGEVALAMGGFLLVFLVRMQRTYSGRRAKVLIEMTGGDENVLAVINYCILGLALMYAFISSLVITDVVVAPDYHKKQPGAGPGPQKQSWKKKAGRRKNERQK